MKLSDFTANKPFVAAAVIAAVSIMVNVYLILLPPVPLALSKQASSSAFSDKLKVDNATLGGAADAELLISLHENVSRNSEQLELIATALSKTTAVASTTEEQAEWDAARELARQEQKQDWEEKMVFHLSEDERAVVFHERWLAKNEFELQQNTEELNRIEQSGIDAIAAYEAKKNKEK